MNKSCKNCLHKDVKGDKLPCSECANESSWEGDCSVCIYITPNDPKKFCQMDDGDDGMSCCGDKFELNPN